MMVFGVTESLANIFLNMHWSIVKAQHGYFVTSDNPVIKWVDRESVSPIYGDGGFANKTIEVSLALNPYKMLLLAHKYNIPRHATIGRLGVDAWNQRRAYYAEQFLYSHIEHEGLARLASRFRGSRPFLTTEGFGPEKFAKVTVPRRWEKKK
jgi:hypothetical protein